MIYLIKKKQGTKGEETQQWWEKVIRKYFSMQKNIPLLTLKSFGWLNSNSDGAFSIYVIYNIILILNSMRNVQYVLMKYLSYNFQSNF